MSLLNTIIKDLKENSAGGATSAHSVAGYQGSLFGGGVMTRNPRRLQDAERLQVPTQTKKFIKKRNQWKWKVLDKMVKESFDDPSFDFADVMSKLDAAEKASNSQEDTVPFGLEDEEGNIVKVYVQADQADDFEAALGSLLANENDDDYIENREIAEVLFTLKDKFEIIDVEWPRIETDEEAEETEDIDLDAEEGADLDLDLDAESREDDPDLDAEGSKDADLDLDLDAEGGEDADLDLEMEPEGGAESALQQVIDMMKSDAEARKAESEARAAEAEARAAEAEANMARHKVEQEEQVLAADAYEKEKKEKKEELERLMKVRKMKMEKDAENRFEKATNAETKLAATAFENEEENMDPRGHVNMDELADLIVTKLRGAIQ